MAGYYVLYISTVDGRKTYSVETYDAKEALDFLVKYGDPSYFVQLACNGEETDDFSEAHRLLMNLREP
jgi:hypothetical protein